MIIYHHSRSQASTTHHPSHPLINNQSIPCTTRWVLSAQREPPNGPSSAFHSQMPSINSPLQQQMPVLTATPAHVLAHSSLSLSLASLITPSTAYIHVCASLQPSCAAASPTSTPCSPDRHHGRSSVQSPLVPFSCLPFHRTSQVTALATSALRHPSYRSSRTTIKLRHDLSHVPGALCAPSTSLPLHLHATTAMPIHPYPGSPSTSLRHVRTKYLESRRTPLP